MKKPSLVKLYLLDIGPHRPESFCLCQRLWALYKDFVQRLCIGEKISNSSQLINFHLCVCLFILPFVYTCYCAGLYIKCVSGSVSAVKCQLQHFDLSYTVLGKIYIPIIYLRLGKEEVLCWAGIENEGEMREMQLQGSAVPLGVDGKEMFTPEIQCKLHCLIPSAPCSEEHVCSAQLCQPGGRCTFAGSFNFMSTFPILTKIKLPQDCKLLMFSSRRAIMKREPSERKEEYAGQL